MGEVQGKNPYPLHLLTPQRDSTGLEGVPSLLIQRKRG